MSDLTTAPPRPVDPRRSPSYPQRVHIRERAHWQAVLKAWNDRIADARQSPRARHERAPFLLAQMAGARDQIADASKRLPMEVGDLYEEDRQRLDEAVRALERTFARWDQLPEG